MTSVRKTMRHTAGALVVLAAMAGGLATPVQAGGSFPAVVEQILMGQTEGLVSTLPMDKKRKLVACVNKVLTDMPNGMKRYVLAATNYNEAEQRFGKVVMQNHAEWKQAIARGCSHIVV
jgi:hypothetical protein